MDTRGILLSVLRDLQIDPFGVNDATDLRNELCLDSTELVEFIVAIEHRLSVELQIDHAIEFGTFGELVAYVESVSHPNVVERA